MVRKAVRTYSQIVEDFSKVDEHDARVRAFYEPSGAPAAVRPSADPDAHEKRPVSASRKHRYAGALDWNDDISAIVNIDRHDGAARTGPLASAFAADRRGNASRALTAALTAAMETASRLSQTPAPTSTHTSRLAMRLLRAAQATLPAPTSPSLLSAAPADGSPSTHISDLQQSTGRETSEVSPTYQPCSPPAISRAWSATSLAPSASTYCVPSGAAHLDLEEQQQLAIASGTLLRSSARMLYYGSNKPRVASDRGRPSSGAPGGGGIPSSGGRSRSSRPVSAPSQQSTPPTIQLPLGRAALMATWVASPRSTSMSGRSRPASAHISGTARRSFSPTCSSSFRAAASPASHRCPGTLTTTSSSPAGMDTSTRRSISPTSATVRQAAPRSSYGSIGPGMLAVIGVGGAHGKGEAADAAVSVVSAETAKSLGMNPRQLHQVQSKHGPSNGLVVRDPVGPQLLPNRRVATSRPFSAPPTGGLAGVSGGAETADSALESPASMRGSAVAPQEAIYPPSPSWQPQQRQAGATSPLRQQHHHRLSASSACGGSPSPPRRRSGSPPQRGDMRRHESFCSVASGTSCDSVAVVAAAAAATTAVNTGIVMARRRHAALAGARKALWAHIADAAGVSTFNVQDSDGNAAFERHESGGGGGGRVSSSYLSANISQQQQQQQQEQVAVEAEEPGSGSSSRLHIRVGDCSTDPPSHTVQLRQTVQEKLQHAPPQNQSEEGSIVEETMAVVTPAATNADTTSVSEQVAANANAVAAPTRTHGSWGGLEHGGGNAEGSQLRRCGSVLRVPSIIKRPTASAAAPATAAAATGADDAASDAAATPSGSKRVQWGATVSSILRQPSQQQQFMEAIAAALPAAGDLVSERGRPLSGSRVSSSGGESGPHPVPGEVGRPPRYPQGLTPLGIGEGGNSGGGSGRPDLLFPGGPNSQVTSVSPNFMTGWGSDGGGGGLASFRRRPPSRRHDREWGDEEEDRDDFLGELPSMEFSTAAGILDRAAASPRAVDGGGDGGGGGGCTTVPLYTEAEFYHLTAIVDRPEDVQGWLFNVYLSDIAPGNPVARRVCIATCTTANQHKQLLVPPPPAARLRPNSASATVHSSAFSTSKPQPPVLRPLPPGPVISPSELLPWVIRPEQLFGHWLRLEAFALAPLADKVVDAITFMGPLSSDTDSPPTPQQPALSKLRIVDVRPAAAAAAAYAAAAAATAALGGSFGSGVHRPQSARPYAPSSPSLSTSSPSKSVLAAALGRQVSSAGSAALVQARLAAEAALPGGVGTGAGGTGATARTGTGTQRPASASPALRRATGA